MLRPLAPLHSLPHRRQEGLVAEEPIHAGIVSLSGLDPARGPRPLAWMEGRLLGDVAYSEGGADAGQRALQRDGGGEDVLGVEAGGNSLLEGLVDEAAVGEAQELQASLRLKAS